jgi:hypothetical protein
VHLQVRIVAAAVLLAALAIGTGTVLLLGYLLAAFSIGVITFIMTRKMIKRIANARLARVRLVPRSSAVTSTRMTRISASRRDRRPRQLQRATSPRACYDERPRSAA